MKTLALFVFASLSLFGATANPVNINSVTVSNGTATVSCGASNCAINANYGFCISGVADNALNVCGTALTGNGGTSFTFTTTASNESLGVAGTVIPARQVICLSTIENSGYVTFNFLLWLTTTTGVSNSALTSQWANSSQALPNTPTGGYLKAIQAGTTIERQWSITLGDTAFAKGNAQSLAQNEFLTEENQLLGSAPGGSVQPGTYYAQFCDPAGCSF